MSTTALGPGLADRQTKSTFWLTYLLVVTVGFVIGAFATTRIDQPYIGVTIAMLLLLSTLWFIRPRVALYTTLFLTLIGDDITVRWFPFNKNMSSRESITYLSDSLTISPLEISLIIGFVVTAATHYARTHRLFPQSDLLRPILAFTAFLVFGLFRGLSTGGDLRIAMFESRALFYLLLMYAVVTTICTEGRQLRACLWWAMAGITVQALLSLLYLNQLTPVARSKLETLTEHGSAIGMNLLLVTTLAALTLRGSNRVLRWLLPLAAVPVTWAYLVSQRRSAIIALVIACVLLFVILFWRQRQTFFRIAPPVMLVGIAYVGAFWNADSTAGFPAQAIKSVIASDQASAEDQSSDLYRIIENYDLNYTIRASPITGLGFGQPFYRPVELPDISFFEFYAYLPHNSILWFWIKTGVFGFITMFYMFAKTIMVGVDRVRRLPDGKDTTITAASVLFVVMLVIYTYVDIAWDVRNMIIFGFAAAVCARPVPVVSDPSTDDPKDPMAQPVRDSSDGQVAVAAQSARTDATRAA